MKLFFKGSIVTLFVLAFQLSFYAVLLNLLLDAERLIEQGDNDRAIHREIAGYSQSFTNAILYSAMFVFMKSRDLSNRVETSVESSALRIRKIQSLPGLTREDKISTQIIEQKLAQLREACLESVSPTREKLSIPFSQASKQLSSKIIPPIIEIQRETVALRDRHERIAISVTNLSSRSLIIAIVVGGIVGTTLLMVLLYVVFAKYIVGRFDHLVRLIEARANNRELPTLLTGSDEFSSLDANFRNLSHRLSETAKREKDIFESMPVALIVCSDDWFIETMNETACKLVKYTAHDLVGKPIAKLCDSLRFSDCTPERVVRCTIQDKNSEIIDVELSLSAFLQDGRARRLVCFMDAREQAEVERLKQQYVAMVSHDIRTPITAVKSFLSVVEENVYGQISDRGRHSVQRSQASTESLLRLTQSLLDLAKNEQNRSVVDRSACSINEVIAKALDSVAADPRAREMELAASNSAKIDTVLLEEGKLLRVFEGLLKSLLSEDEANLPAGISVVVDFTNRTLGVTMTSYQHSRTEDSHSPLAQRQFSQSDEVGDAFVDRGELLICRLMIESLGGGVSIQNLAHGARCIKVSLPAEEAQAALASDED